MKNEKQKKKTRIGELVIGQKNGGFGMENTL